MDTETRTRSEYRAKIVQAYGSLLVPIMLLFLTLSFNNNASRSAAAEGCRGKMLELFDKTSDAETSLDGKSPTARDAVLRRFEMAFGMIVESCGTAELRIPSQLTIFEERFRCRKVEEEYQCAGPAVSEFSDTAAPAQSDIGQKTGETDPPTATDPGPATPGSVASPTSPLTPGPLRLYIQIGSESQRQGATRLQTKLDGSSWGRGKLIVPNGIDLADPVASNQLRCLKRADCMHAQSLADLIAQTVPGLSLQIIDLSNRYEKSGSVRPGTYELWLAPGAQLGG